MLVATRSTPRKINLVFQPVRVIFCQPASKAKPCIIFIASNKVGNKNAFVTWQPLHRFLQPHHTKPQLHLGAGQGSAKATKNVELSEKVPPARSPSSSMFLQPASYASLPPYPPPITNMTSAPLPLIPSSFQSSFASSPFLSFYFPSIQS